MDEPREAELPPYRVARLRYEGAPPPDPAFFDHWRRFRALTERFGIASAVADIEAIGYAPPMPYGSAFAYDACVPVGDGTVEGIETGLVPGGRFVLCAGPIGELPALLQRSRRYAMSHGLAVERGWIEIYRPLPDGGEPAVDVGYRIHD